MAEENIKDFTVNWILGGFLVFCLLTFTITFIYYNNSNALDDGTEDILNYGYENSTNKLLELTESSDSLLNITANTNPEVSDLGSRDSVSTSFGAKRTASSNWNDMKMLIAWVFSGTTGNILLAVIGSIVGFLSLFYIWRFIRIGS